MRKEFRKIISDIRGAVLLSLIFVATIVEAQNISVSSFKLLENDLTANTAGTMERDQNGEVAALIKVVTSEQGFVFDGGMTGIVKTKQEVGEVWVYVPYGIKKVTIKHSQLGVLRDYYFPIPIEKAKTYEMVLTTGKVETIVTHSVNKQFVVFNVKPADAIVELGDEVLTVDSEGYATKSMPFGTYDYRVTCANYHTTAGKVTVNAQGKAEVNVTLRPNFGWIRFDGDSEYHKAFIYIDNERVGQVPFTTGNIKSGAHRIKVVKPMYKTYEHEVTVQDDETTEVNVQLVPNFATVTLVTDENSEIWVDGTRKGKGRWTGPMEIGEYTVEVKKESHRTVSEIVQIHTIGERTIQLKSPTPIYGALEISSNPLRATVYIDDEEVGETPLILNNVLVGSRRVTFKKEGYETTNKTVVVKENEENSLSAILEKPQVVVTEIKPAAKVPQSQPVKKNVPTAKKSKLAGWGGMLDISFGCSDISILNYGGELGISYGGFSLSMGARSHFMGYYHVTYNDNDDLLESQQIQLLRFSTKIGYTLGLGRYIRITPQVGLVYGPSYFMGKEYITGEIFQNSDPDKVITDVVFSPSDDYGDIQRFIDMRHGIVAGARFELGTRNAGFGVYATPEYLLSEGFKLNVGLVFRF